MSATQRLIETSKAVMRKYAVEAHTCIVLRQFEDALAAAKEEQAGEVTDVRPCVQWFARQMEAKLRANDHRGGWIDNGMQEFCFGRLDEEVKELKECQYGDDRHNPDRWASEAADVANFAMMLADMNGPRIGPAAKEEAERKVLTDKEIERIACEIAPQWGVGIAIEAIRYARGNGYLAPAKGLDVDDVMEVVADWVDCEMNNMPTSGLTSVRGSRQFQQAMMPLRKALEAITAKNRGDNLRTDPWMSVEDGLPEVGVKVLTYSPVDGCEMMVEELEDAANPESWEASLGVTHWMPLPAPPDNTGK